MRRLLVLLSVFLLTGCLGQSVNPVSPASLAEMDRRLTGSWRMRGIDKATGRVKGILWLHIGPRYSEQPYLQGVMLSFERGVMKVSQYLLHTSRVGNIYFLNIKSVVDGKPSDHYMIMRYTIDDRGLSLYFPLQRKLRALIESGRLKGVVKGSFSSVTLTDTSEQLARVLSRSADEIFDSRAFGPFQRIR